MEVSEEIKKKDNSSKKSVNKKDNNNSKKNVNKKNDNLEFTLENKIFKDTIENSDEDTKIETTDINKDTKNEKEIKEEKEDINIDKKIKKDNSDNKEEKKVEEDLEEEKPSSIKIEKINDGDNLDKDKDLNVSKKKEIKKKEHRQYDYDKDTLYEEVDNDNKKYFQIKYILFLLMIFGIFIIIYLIFPRISLVGDKTIVLNYNEEYVEPGYRGKFLFRDTKDKIQVSSNLIENKIGSYQIDYVYKFWFLEIKRTRNIEIVDKDLPMISLEKEDIKLCPKDDISKIKYKAVDEYDGDITDKVKILEKDNKITFSVMDSSSNYFEKTIDLVREDSEKPAITLTGNTTMYINLGTRYIEPGYKAQDNCDGDITSKVLVSGSVGSGVGTYQVTYMVSDSSGNKTQVVRKVVVRNNYLYNNGSINNGTIYLTFDDGPNEGTTNYILDVLKDEGVKATFFVTCNGPDYLIKRMHDEGHTVALHTATHNYAYIYSSTSNYFADLQRVSDRVKRITSVESKIIRFPGGSSNTVSRNYHSGIMTDLTYQVLDKGYRYYDWNVDSNDAGGASSSSQVYYNVINHLLYNRSNMVLMHDNKYTTRGAIRDIIRYGKSNGYKFEKITMDTYMVRHAVNN